MYYKSKENITKLVLSEIPNDEDNPWKDFQLDHIVFRWWVTGRTGEGLRLSGEGAKAFEYANIRFYEFLLGIAKNYARSPETFVQELSKKIKCPYYIPVDNGKNPSIRVYDSKVAMMITLYGSFREYLNSL